MNNNNYAIVFGKLAEGFRDITSRDARDLIHLSEKKSFCGKVFIAIKLTLQLKGFITESRIKNILQGYIKKNQALVLTPELEQLFKAYNVGLQNLNPQEKNPNGEKKELKDIKVEKLDEGQAKEVPDEQEKKPEDAKVDNKGKEPAVPQDKKISNWGAVRAVKALMGLFDKALTKTPEVAENPKIDETVQDPLKQDWNELQKKLTHEELPLLNNFKDPIRIENSSKKYIVAERPKEENKRAFWEHGLYEDFGAIMDFSSDKKVPYAPTDGPDGDLEFDTFKVFLHKQEGDESFYYVRNNEDDLNNISRVHYKNWPKKGMIAVEELNRIVGLFKSNEPTVIFDNKSGRAGTFITASMLKEKITDEEINKENYKEKISEIILATKQGSVVTYEQFQLLHSFAEFLFSDKETLDVIAERHKKEADAAKAREERANAEAQRLEKAEQAPPEGPKVLTEKDIIAEKWQELVKKTQDFRNQQAEDDYLPMNTSTNKQGVNLRFPNIRCPKKTAVSVKREVGEEYINANHVGEGFTSMDFIVSQAPLVSDYQKFWEVVFEDRDLIVDLSGTGDRFRGVNEYAPLNKDPYSNDNTNGSPQTYGDITVTLDEVKQVDLPLSDEEKKKMIEAKETLPFYMHYTYTLRYKDESVEPRNVSRIHFAGWADHGVTSMDHLDIFVNLFDIYKKPLIHCRAGVGRSGVLASARVIKEKLGLVADVVKKAVEKGEITEENYRDKISEIVFGLRIQRGVYDPINSFVQTDEQFELIHNYTRHLLKI